MSVFSLQHKVDPISNRQPTTTPGAYPGRSESGQDPFSDTSNSVGDVFTKQVRLPALILFVLSGIFFALRFAGIAIEDLQTFLFPLFFAGFLLLFRGFRFQASWVAVGLTLGIWALGALHVRGYLGPDNDAAYFARLDNDPTGLVGRGVMLRINHIADTYELSGTVPLQREFKADGEARSWIAHQIQSPALVTGSNELLTVLVSPNLDQSVDRMLSRFRRAPLGHVAEVDKLALGYGFDPEKEGVKIALPGSDDTLILVSAPESIAVPGRPVEMNRHYLAWLLNGMLRLAETDAGPALRQLGLKKKDIFPDLVRLPAAIDSFNEASRIVGDWPSPVPMITARYFLATLFMVEGLDGRFEEAPLFLAEDQFRSAAGFAKRETSDPVVAAMWNNRAVTRLLLADDDDGVREAKRWLLRAASMTDLAGKPLRGAKAAMVNLILVERAGL